MSGASRWLRRDLALALVFKAAALALLYAAFFAPHRIDVTPQRMEAAILGPSAAGAR